MDGYAPAAGPVGNSVSRLALSLRDSPQLNGYAVAQYNLPAYHDQHCFLTARVADNVELLSGAASDAQQPSDVPVNENEKLRKRKVKVFVN